MSQRYFLAKLRGEDDISGIILRAAEDDAATLREATSLLSHLNARPVADYEIVLVPYFPPERSRIDLSTVNAPTTMRTSTAPAP